MANTGQCMSHTVYLWISLKFLPSAIKDGNENRYSLAGGNILHMRILFFWGLTHSHRVNGSHCFEGTYCFHFQGLIGYILNFLKNCLQENLFLTLAINLIIFFWVANTFLLFVEFLQNVNSVGNYGIELCKVN